MKWSADVGRPRWQPTIIFEGDDMIRLFWTRPKNGKRTEHWAPKARIGWQPALFDTEAQATAVARAEVFLRPMRKEA